MAPRLKPPARARRPDALVRRERYALTAQAIDALFADAEVLTEGGLDGGGCWYGSVMITFDLSAVAARCRGLDDEESVARLVEAVEGSVRVRVRAHRMACAEVYQRFPDRRVGTAQIESEFRREDTRLLVDIDVEVPIAQAPLEASRD